MNVYDYLKNSIPSDHCQQTRAIDMAKQYLRLHSPNMIVDLGCGTGNTVGFFRDNCPSAKWVGVDIEDSPEVAQRTRSDAEFRTFDGMNIPFEDRTVDFVYSNQVLEHVRYPESLLRSVARILTDDGIFIGQTSHLEPYHSFSYWNFTPFGFKRLCEDAGLDVAELRPGIDGITLTERTFKGRPPEFSRWFADESPYNQDIENQARSTNANNKIINFRKLMLCGQFAFACKPRR